MKNHRFPALLLSLILTFSLAAPAWAAEEDTSAPPAEAGEEAGLEAIYDADILAFARQYREDHPEEWAAFDADAWYKAEWSYYYDSKKEYMEDFGLTSEAEFQEDMWVEYVLSTEEGKAFLEAQETAESWKLIEEYRAAHPGELEALDIDEILASWGYREPIEAYMNDHGLTSRESVEADILSAYVIARQAAEARHVQAEAFRAADPESWASFDADSFFEKNYYFYGDKEYFMQIWDLISEEEFADYMYLQYMTDTSGWYQPAIPDPSLVVNGKRYAGNSFTLVDGTSYLASDELSAILGATLETSGETPAPIRAAAEAAGWDVVWNEYHRQVILLDREKLMTGYIIPYTWEYVPCDFSGYAELMGRLNAAQPGKGRSLRTKEAYEVTLTLMNSLDGDETYHFGLDGEMLSRDQVCNLDLTLDLAGLRELLGEDLFTDLLSSLSPVDRETFLENLGNLRFRAIWDQGEGNLAWNLPVLSLLEPSFDPETWFVQSTNAGSLSDAERMTLSDPEALNELLYTSFLDACATDTSRWSDGETIYQSFLASKAFLNALAGDVAITREGENLVWDLTGGMTSLWGTAYNSIYYYGDIPEFTDLFREFTCRLTVAPDGTTTTEVSIRPDMEAIAQASANEWDSPMETAMTAFLLNVVDFRYTAQGQSKGGTGTAHMEFQLKNQFKLAVDVKSEARGSDDLPLTQPPEDSPVQNL